MLACSSACFLHVDLMPCANRCTEVGDALCHSDLTAFCFFLPFSCFISVPLLPRLLLLLLFFKIVWYVAVVLQEECPRQQVAMMNVSV